MSYEQSAARLEAIRSRSPKMVEAAIEAISRGRVDVAKFGINREGAVERLSGRRKGLESASATLGSMMGLEAIVRRVGRPPLLVLHNEVRQEPLDDFPPDIGEKIAATQVFTAAVGRVEFVNATQAWGGTGWVVDERPDGHLVLTNRHVAQIVARRLADGRSVFMRSPITGVRYGVRVDFNRESGASPQEARPALATDIAYLAEDAAADMALLKVKKAGAGEWSMPEPVPLAGREASGGEIVALIGFPAFDSRNDRTAMDEYFHDLYEVKRFAPGKVEERVEGAILSHDCTSLGGNSGSPLISLDQNAAVGLHFAGVYGIENSAVSVATIKALLKGTLMCVSSGLREAKLEAPDGRHRPEDLQSRPGFDPNFLGSGFETPWPKLPQELAAGLASPSDATQERPHELRYMHFGVLFSKKLRLPVMTATNIDGERAVRIKCGGNRWFFDGRIDIDAQYGQSAYQDDSIDRGHMVRREDPNWGDLARVADGDTFHYTNAAPQHSALNQGKALWQGLENYILDNARTHGFKANVFTAPVHRDDDPLLEKENARIPMEFFKVVVMVDADRDELHATAYLLSQGQLIGDLLVKRNRSESLEGFTLGAYRTFQIAIRDLEAATGFDFGSLRNYDPLRKHMSSREAVGNDLPVALPLDSLADIVVG
ncbi:DNA/RNA non-specific endonuclease [Methylosinus sp. KRF6]|uniref:DNA/RNA non-specific endonuclease n=1 Tax=Methylosinus sp. KRF6 TaxID=2846853 RepID=UPI001C0DA39A|nr:DNA/RNA non-specific endonuclease [Methylosinus sp. KRF6]